jgi:NAD-dependent dihydropyrimidine dehydrogenase PreA subunit
MYNVVVNTESCTGCEECVNVCPQGVFQMTNAKSDPCQTGECVFCESCLGVCPSNSIAINEI